MRVSRAFYNFALDGGVVGQIILRGAIRPPHSWIWSFTILEVVTVGFGAGTTLDFGTISNPAELTAGIDNTQPTGAAPDAWLGPNTLPASGGINFGLASPFVMTINVAPLTAGELWIYVRSVDL